MSGVQGSSAGAISSSAIVDLPVAHHHRRQEITVAQFSDEAVDKIKGRVRANQKEGEELRGWLMVLATLTASITYAAALNPPGGVWQADDAANHFVAGYPVLLDKSPRRYYVFYYCNATSFASSVCIIVLLAITNLYLSDTKIMVFNVLVALDMVSLGAAFVAGSSSSKRFTAFNAALMVCLVVLFLLWKRKCLMGQAAANPNPTVKQVIPKNVANLQHDNSALWCK